MLFFIVEILIFYFASLRSAGTARAGARELRSLMTARKQLVECSAALASSIRIFFGAHELKLESGNDHDFCGKVLVAMKELAEMALSFM